MLGSARSRHWPSCLKAQPLISFAVRIKAEGSTGALRSILLRSLRPHLHLAVPFRPALAVVLRAALYGHRVIRHVLGDDRARADIGALADFHRRHQRGVGADKGALADQRLVLEEAVVIAGDGAGAEIG